jgi:hypothetical protein
VPVLPSVAGVSFIELKDGVPVRSMGCCVHLLHFE